MDSGHELHDTRMFTRLKVLKEIYDTRMFTRFKVLNFLEGHGRWGLEGQMGGWNLNESPASLGAAPCVGVDRRGLGGLGEIGRGGGGKPPSREAGGVGAEGEVGEGGEPAGARTRACVGCTRAFS